jgi:carbamoyl-phosphate synthase small subunit
MTYPLIGDYGQFEGHELKPTVKAFIIRELTELPHNWHGTQKLSDYLAEKGIGGLYGVDTRALTRALRGKASIKGCITENYPTQDQILMLNKYQSDRSPYRVTCSESYTIDGEGATVAVLDLGLKPQLISSLTARGCKVVVFPAGSTKEEILACNPDGIVLSNGPGDPTKLDEIVATVKSLLNVKPILGVCLGHLVLALAAGGKVVPNVHRGSNQPIKELAADRVYSTTQNHEFAVDSQALPADVEVTYLNWNDQSVEGLKYNAISAIGVQFHPESAPQPSDTAPIIDSFMDMMKASK